MTENDGTVPPTRDPASAGDGHVADRLRWGRVVVVVTVGLSAIAGACALPLMLGDAWGAPQAILASTLAAAGANVLLAAVLFWIEREIVQDVRVAASASASAAVEAGTRELRENTAHLAQRLDEIDDQLNQRHDRQEAHRTEMLAELAETPSWDVLVSAMREADRLKAVADREIVAPLTGDIDVDAPRITVKLTVMTTTNHGGGISFGGWDDAEDILEMVVSAGDTSAEVTWRQGESAAEMLGALVDDLTPKGMNAVKDTVTAVAVFQSLKQALDQAITVRTDSEPWFGGSMIERLDDEWVVTDKGLESRSFGVVLSLHDVPPAVSFLAGRTGGAKPAEPGPPAGVDVDSGFWKAAVGRTYHHAHTRRHRRTMGTLGYS